jgi:Protein of unknown function (DUF3987)
MNTTAEGKANKPQKPPLIWPEENEQTRNMSFCELYRLAPGPQIQWELDRVLKLSKEKQKKWWQELYEWWRKGKPDHKTRLRKSSEGFPAPARKEAFHGILGEIVKIITDGSELKPEAVLAQSLVSFGSILGRGPYKYQESRHGSNINIGIIGTTSDGAKGGSLRAVQNLVYAVDPWFAKERMKGGHQSGEAIIEEVADELLGFNKETGEEEVLIEEQDKRFVMVEEELSRIFRLQGRGGSIITQILRQCYDSPELLAAPSRKSKLKSTRPHISVIGHITPEELKSSMSKVEVYNGFANRIIWIASERTQDIPEPKRVDWCEDYPGIVRELRSLIAGFFEKAVWEFQFSDEGRDSWISAYYEFNEAGRGKVGLMGALLARAKPNVLRMALIYAALDRSALIEPEHIAAARALWDYSVESSKWAFANNSGNRIADVILAELRRTGKSGIRKTDIANNVLRKNTGGGEINAALDALRQNGQADFRTEKEGGKQGRPPEIWFAT